MPDLLQVALWVVSNQGEVGGPLNRDHHQAQFSHGEKLGKE